MELGPVVMYAFSRLAPAAHVVIAAALALRTLAPYRLSLTPNT